MCVKNGKLVCWGVVNPQIPSSSKITHGRGKRPHFAHSGPRTHDAAPHSGPLPHPARVGTGKGDEYASLSAVDASGMGAGGWGRPRAIRRAARGPAEKPPGR